VCTCRCTGPSDLDAPSVRFPLQGLRKTNAHTRMQGAWCCAVHAAGGNPAASSTLLKLLLQQSVLLDSGKAGGLPKEGGQAPAAQESGC